MKKEEVVKWAKEHKTILVDAGLLVGGAVLAAVGVKMFNAHHSQKPVIQRPELSDFEKNIKYIDEMVFTDLAPNIEAALINKGREQTILERAYDYDENLSKFVTVTIENVYGD